MVLPSGVASAASLSRVGACAANLVSEVPVERWTLEAPSPSDGRGWRGACGTAPSSTTRTCSTRASSACRPPRRRRWTRSSGCCSSAATRRCTAQGSAAELHGADVGVYLGIACQDFATADAGAPPVESVYAATGTSHSIASGRLSFALGLQGPCSLVDTACSAARWRATPACGALSLARVPLRQLVLGVNMMMVPNGHEPFAVAGMTLARGRCHTWDARADGYAARRGVRRAHAAHGRA